MAGDAKSAKSVPLPVPLSGAQAALAFASSAWVSRQACLRFDLCALELANERVVHELGGGGIEAR
jgi:hypothetical protein